MAFNAVFYTFSKKERSTATPSSGGTTYSCTADQPLDVLSPVIRLSAGSSPVAFNYCHITDFSRWYFVTGWTFTEGLWQASLRVDALASWKTEIGNNRCYVYRSSSAWQNRLPDAAYPQMTNPHRLTVQLPKVWTVGGANESGAARDTFSIVVGIIGSNDTRFYAMDWTNWRRFYSTLFSQNYYNAVLGEFGATEYPEAKVAINPLQYIASANIVPLGIGLGLNLRYGIEYVSQVSTIPVGNVSVAPSTFTAYSLGNGQSQWANTIQLGSDFWHPQADDRGDWLNYSPATEYIFYFPPIGEIPLAPEMIDGADSITYTVYPDFKANVAMLDIVSNFSDPAREYPLFRSEFSLGTGIQLSNVLTTGTWAKLAHDILGLGADNPLGVAMHIGQFLPVVGGVFNNAVENAIHGRSPKLFSTGQFGSTAMMGGQPRLIVTHWIYAPDDLDGKGRPLCDIRQLSAIPGFITAEADEISVPCTDPELSEIRQSVSSGFFYE